MRIGFAHIPSFALQDSVQLIEDADRWGFDTAWLPDQPFYLDPYPLLTEAAGRTDQITLGVGVTNPFTTHPVMTARITATVAERAPGRLILGLGTGNRREFLRPLGYEGRGSGVDWCREAIKVIRALWDGETTGLDDYFVAYEAKLSFTARNDIPIYLAGIGQRILEVAGEHADGAIINFASPRALRIALDHLKVGRSRSDREKGEGEVVAWATALFTRGDPSRDYDRVRPFIAHSLAPTSRSTLKTLGLEEPQINILKEDYRRHGPEHAARHVTNEMIDDWSWIGSPDVVAEKVLALAELGVTEAAIVPFTRDLDEMRSIIKDFATVVAPHLR